VSYLTAALSKLALRADERFTLRATRKRLHPPGVVPPGADEGASAGRATQVLTNEDGSPVLTGFAVSPGRVVGEASLVLDAGQFHKMKPNTILVCQMTSPAWTQVRAHYVYCISVHCALLGTIQLLMKKRAE
jgi:phosphoenolpyruvate synthase/pyruvate phosphate dikinase